MKLGVSTYSYWHFTPERVEIETVIDKAAELDLDGVEILHRQMASEEKNYLQNLKRRAFIQGLDLYALSIHQGFVFPDVGERNKNVDHTIHCIELAYDLGIPAIRLNSGRWGTIKSFDELMRHGGNEPVLPGYTEDDAFDWIIESIETCLPFAEKNGVILGLENHWGLTNSPRGVDRIVSAIDSDWLMVTMDCGNFLDEPYEKLEQISSQAVLVHAKTYYGGGEWYTLELDYVRIAGILKDVGFNGYISLEFEGKADADIGVPKSVDLLRKAFQI